MRKKLKKSVGDAVTRSNLPHPPRPVLPPHLLLIVDPPSIKTVKDASSPFVSLVAFIEGGNDLDDKATKQAFEFLNWIIPGDRNHFFAYDLLIELVPQPDRSCSGFVESMIPLLTSSNARIAKSAMSLLERVVTRSVPRIRFWILETGLFPLLLNSFHDQKMHLARSSKLFLLDIVKDFLSCLDPAKARETCKTLEISMDFFQQTFMTKFMHPIEQFLENTFRNRSRWADSVMSGFVPKFLGRILELSLFSEEMTQLVVSSSFAVAYADYLHFVEKDRLTEQILQYIPEGVNAWRKDKPDVWKRKKQILAKLREEGISDEIELNFRFRRYINT
ncbi:hypothetical protein BLNAU_17767 [Blattamonas nauphoetae]|uniref:Uncharacterized protein n=1 Tax=Blattamonas nauphoetae TaxID=2049346 RepID=A0ABQ9XAH6_9EUKA|nr:hypothetical protein BLNAU_17767 [Blattamonas nauphoetae]